MDRRKRGYTMKIYQSPYFDHSDGLDIMIMDDPSEDGWEVYYRMAGYPYIFAFGLPKKHTMSMFTVISLAKANASEYVEVLFH